jgi:hypothetical protein
MDKRGVFTALILSKLLAIYTEYRYNDLNYNMKDVLLWQKSGYPY